MATLLNLSSRIALGDPSDDGSGSDEDSAEESTSGDDEGDLIPNPPLELHKDMEVLHGENP